MKKRIFSLVMAVLMLLTFNISANAQSCMQPRYSYTVSVTPRLSITSSQANCSVIITGESEVTKIKVKIILQKKGLLKWNNVTIWTHEVNSTRLSTNYHYGPLNSDTYRVKVEATVYAGSASETITSYSSQVKI